MATNPIRPTDEASIALARLLMRSGRSGALATCNRDGSPLATLALTATDADGTPVILVSALSGHTQNLRANARASLLIAQGGKGDPLAHPRVSISALARFTGRESPEGVRIRRRFLAKHPKAALYADFGDFSFVALGIQSVSLNGGFGRAYELSAADVLTRIDDAGDLIEAEDGALAHLNGDHAETLSLYAARLAGEKPGKWRATGLDPGGLDLALGDRTARIAFGERVTGAGRLRAVLKELADLARAAD